MRTALGIAILVAFAWLAGASVTRAEQPAATGCAALAWSVDEERAWLGAPSIETFANGTRLSGVPKKAIALTLGPSASVKLPIAPTGKPHHVAPEPHAGFATIADVSEPGLYQVTLADVAWIDVIQNGVALQSQNHTGAKDCPGIRKSVRFQLAAGETTIQLSSVSGATIRFAMRRVPRAD